MWGDDEDRVLRFAIVSVFLAVVLVLLLILAWFGRGVEQVM